MENEFIHINFLEEQFFFPFLSYSFCCMGETKPHEGAKEEGDGLRVTREFMVLRLDFQPSGI